MTDISMTDVSVSTAHADVSMSLRGDGSVIVYGRLRGTDVDTVKAFGQALLDNLSAGKKTIVRSEPEATEERDYETGDRYVTGIVRFIVLQEDGDAEKPDVIDQAEILPFRSAAKAAAQ